MLRRALLAIAALVIILQPASAARAAHPAEATVETLHAAMLDAMQNAEKLGFNGRLAKLTPALDKVYLFPEMARVASGSHWKNFDDTQKTKLSQAYARMSAATYAARLIGYSGEKFETLGVEDLPPPNKGVVVRSRLLKSNGKDDVKLDYRLIQSGDAWRIVDVYYNGSISELATQRSQYLAILEKQGHAGLVSIIENKMADLASGKKPE